MGERKWISPSVETCLSSRSLILRSVKETLTEGALVVVKWPNIITRRASERRRDRGYDGSPFCGLARDCDFVSSCYPFPKV